MQGWGEGSSVGGRRHICQLHHFAQNLNSFFASPSPVPFRELGTGSLYLEQGNLEDTP